ADAGQVFLVVRLELLDDLVDLFLLLVAKLQLLLDLGRDQLGEVFQQLDPLLGGLGLVVRLDLTATYPNRREHRQQPGTHDPDHRLACASVRRLCGKGTGILPHNGSANSPERRRRDIVTPSPALRAVRDRAAFRSALRLLSAFFTSSICLLNSSFSFLS